MPGFFTRRRPGVRVPVRQPVFFNGLRTIERPWLFPALVVDYRAALQDVQVQSSSQVQREHSPCNLIAAL